MHDAVRIPGIALIASALPLLATMAPRAGENVAVFASPFAGESALAIMARAEGQLVATTTSGKVVIARSEDPNFIAHLRKAGAWLVLDAKLIRGCLSG